MSVTNVVSSIKIITLPTLLHAIQAAHRQRQFSSFQRVRQEAREEADTKTILEVSICASGYIYWI